MHLDSEVRKPTCANIMRTSDAVTHAGGIWVTFAIVVAVYVALGATLIIALRAMSRRWRSEDGQDEGGPYSPEPGLPADLSAKAAG